MLFICVTAHAQINPQTRVCGQIPNGSLSLPAYRFQLLDEEGNKVAGTKAIGEVTISEYKWDHHYGDWNWEETSHLTPIPMSFDNKEQVWLSAAIPKIPVVFRKGLHRPNCWDQIQKIVFNFTSDDGNSSHAGVLLLDIKNRKVEQLDFPSGDKPIQVVLNYKMQK